MLTITDRREGACQLCMEPSLGYDCKFQDGLKGFFCQEHMLDLLWKRIADKYKKEEAQAEAKATQNAKPQTSGKEEKSQKKEDRVAVSA